MHSRLIIVIYRPVARPRAYGCMATLGARPRSHSPVSTIVRGLATSSATLKQATGQKRVPSSAHKKDYREQFRSEPTAAPFDQSAMSRARLCEQILAEPATASHDQSLMSMTRSLALSSRTLSCDNPSYVTHQMPATPDMTTLSAILETTPELLPPEHGDFADESTTRAEILSAQRLPINRMDPRPLQEFVARKKCAIAAIANRACELSSIHSEHAHTFSQYAEFQERESRRLEHCLSTVTAILPCA